MENAWICCEIFLNIFLFFKKSHRALPLRGEGAGEEFVNTTEADMRKKS